MDQLDANLSVQEETKQMKKLQLYQRLVFFTLLKYKFSILMIFIAVVGLGVIGRYIQFSRSPFRYEGSVTLFYTPRASEEVKPLSINQVLNIFSRQQCFHRLVEELHLTPRQQAVLKSSIEVKLMRDQNDMFIITGKGESDEFVKNLVNTFAAIGCRAYDEYRTKELRNYLDAREKRLGDLELFQKNRIEELHKLHRQYGIIHPKEEMENIKKIQGEQDASMAELNVKLADARHRFSVVEMKYKQIPPAVILHRDRLREYIREVRTCSREYEKAKLIFSERNPRYVASQTAFLQITKEFEEFKKENGITNFREGMLVNLEGLINEYTHTLVALRQVEMSMKSLQAEIKLIAAKEKKLQHMIPEHDRVERLQSTISKNISLLVEELSRVRSNLAHVVNDINTNERVLNTKAFPMFPVKILAVLFIAGIFVSGLYGTLAVFFDLLNGHFSGLQEAAFHKDFFTTVGVIPDEKANFSAEQRNTLNNETFYRFILDLKATRTIFSCSLDGSFLSSVLFDEQFSKAKRNTILVRLIPAFEAQTRCANMQKIGDFYYSDNGNSGTNYTSKDVNHNLEYLQGFSTGDGKGYGYGYGFAFVPVRNMSCLEPDEISTLYNIVSELKQHYQLIRIAREKPFDASCLIVRQLHDICDATLLYIGKNKTPRKVLRRVLKLHDDERKIYAILTGVTNIKAVTSGDFI